MNLLKTIMILIFLSSCNISNLQLNAAYKEPKSTTLILSNWSNNFFKENPEFGKAISKETTFKKTFKVEEKQLEDALNKLIEKLKAGIVNNNGLIQEIDQKKENCDAISYIQKIQIPNNSTIIVFGDFHGSAHSLIRNLLRLKVSQYLFDDLKLKNGTYLIFTGDYINRGRYGAEILYLIANLKITNPDKVFILRGNHETKTITNAKSPHDTFSIELSNNYPKEASDQSLLKLSYTLFKWLPSALFIKNNHDAILFCHGGLPYNHSDKKIPLDPKDFLDKKDITCLKVDQNIMNGFLYGEFHEGESITTALKASDFNYAASFGIDSLKKDAATLGFNTILRGHEHNNSAVSIPDGQGRGPFKGGKYLALWDKIKKTISLAENPVYTFMSCPEGQGHDPAGANCEVDGYGILKVKTKGFSDAELTPCEFKLPDNRDESYTNVEYKNGGIIFKWIKKEKEIGREVFPKSSSEK